MFAALVPAVQPVRDHDLAPEGAAMINDHYIGNGQVEVGSIGRDIEADGEPTMTLQRAGRSSRFMRPLVSQVYRG